MSLLLLLRVRLVATPKTRKQVAICTLMQHVAKGNTAAMVVVN